MKACIFDLDGTILDTLMDLFESINLALDKNQFPQRTKEEIRCFVGNGVKRLVARALPSDVDEVTREKVYKDFVSFYEQHRDYHTKPYEDIIELLEVLKTKGIQCAVLSNKNDVDVQPLCKKYFPEQFDVVLGLRSDFLPKPAPEGLLKVCEALKVLPEDCLYIGDSEVDLQTGAAAGMKVVSVTWGFRTRAELIQSQANCLIDKPMELINILG